MRNSGYGGSGSKPDNNMMSLILERQGICSKEAAVKRETSGGMQSEEEGGELK